MRVRFGAHKKSAQYYNRKLHHDGFVDIAEVTHPVTTGERDEYDTKSARSSYAIDCMDECRSDEKDTTWLQWLRIHVKGEEGQSSLRPPSDPLVYDGFVDLNEEEIGRIVEMAIASGMKIRLPAGMISEAIAEIEAGLGKLRTVLIPIADPHPAS
jgi:hypothetical protein